MKRTRKLRPAKDMDVGSVHETRNFGDVRIVKYRGTNSVEVEFIKSGWRCEVTADRIRNGMLKDLMQPTNCGVGYIGDGNYKSSNNGVYSHAYTAWSHMMTRCYSDEFHKTNPTYRDCEVCEEWQSFQSFAKWYYDNYPNDGGKYQLDKDIKIDGNRTYSPEACSFVSAYENMAKAQNCYGRFAIVKSPSGDLHKVTNIAEFCRDNNLHSSHMSDVIRSKIAHYKGWKLHKLYENKGK